MGIRVGGAAKALMRDGTRRTSRLSKMWASRGWGTPDKETGNKSQKMRKSREQVCWTTHSTCEERTQPRHEYQRMEIKGQVRGCLLYYIQLGILICRILLNPKTDMYGIRLKLNLSKLGSERLSNLPKITRLYIII